MNISQIFYKDYQRPFLDKAFKPLDNSGFDDETLEFAVFQRLYGDGVFEDSDYFGGLSWRFKEKTGLTGGQLLETVRSEPDVDLFYMNPFPHNEALHQSLWLHGETAHPKFLEIAQAFLVSAGFEEVELYKFTHSSQFSVCNYFVGRAAFWRAYIPFVEGCLARAEANMPGALRQMLHSVDGDWKGIHKGSTYVPFIVERLLPVFLRSDAGRVLSIRQVPLPAREAALNADLRELRQMKDMAVLARSDRILDLWREKREAYCRIYFSKEWCNRNLKMLNDAPVVW